MLYMSINLRLSNSLKLQHLLLLYFCIIQLTLNAEDIRLSCHFKSKDEEFERKFHMSGLNNSL
jgi:hypothetical protein